MAKKHKSKRKKKMTQERAMGKKRYRKKEGKGISIKTVRRMELRGY